MKREKKKKKALLVSETTSTSQGCTSKSDKGQETTTTVSAAGRTMTIEHIEQGDESKKTQKTDDELEREKEPDTEEQKEVDTGAREKRTDDEETEDESSIVGFEDPVYELSQAYEMEPEYESMTAEQEAAEVQALSPVGQAEY